MHAHAPASLGFPNPFAPLTSRTPVSGLAAVRATEHFPIASPDLGVTHEISESVAIESPFAREAFVSALCGALAPICGQRCTLLAGHSDTDEHQHRVGERLVSGWFGDYSNDADSLADAADPDGYRFLPGGCRFVFKDERDAFAFANRVGGLRRMMRNGITLDAGHERILQCRVVGPAAGSRELVAVDVWTTSEKLVRRRVVIESPYAGDVEANVAYARRCVLDSLRRGEAPFASHLLYTQPGILDDLVAEERTLGIDAGLAWGAAAELVAVYIDRGVSPGMIKGVIAHREAGRAMICRSLDAGRDIPVAHYLCTCERSPESEWNVCPLHPERAR